MSNTRRAADDSAFHQSRYSSSSEFDRGLIANLVAKRVSIVSDKQDRSLIWFLQFLSHQDGGLRDMALELAETYREKMGTPAMVKIGKPANKEYSADEVKRVRMELPEELRDKFPLNGETKADLLRLHPRIYRLAREVDAIQSMGISGRVADGHGVQSQNDSAQTKRRPASYPVSAFQKICYDAAVSGENGKMIALERELYELCLDPARSLTSGEPWYFADLVNALRDYHQKWIEAKTAAIVVTKLGRAAGDVLDYTLSARVLSLMQGVARTGKTFAARAWCEQNPGRARFIEVPPNNDDAGFFRALARGLGLGNFLKYKVCEIRERVESVLLAGDLVLVLDEAQRLWPQRDLRHCFPTRINWLMSMVNAGVPICLVATPQFLEWQTAAQERGGWNSAQLVGRIGHYKPLPAELEIEDLMAVGNAILPEAGEVVLKALAAYARTSARYLAAVDSITRRAKYLAEKDGRKKCTAEDVRIAMKESVIPSDTQLVSALERGRGKKQSRQTAAAVPVTNDAPEILDSEELPAHRRFKISTEQPQLQP